MREESTNRMIMFLECVRLELRFEEKENEWKEMLDGLRRPIVNVCTSYYDLQREVCSVTGREDILSFQLYVNTSDELDRESITVSL